MRLFCLIALLAAGCDAAPREPAVTGVSSAPPTEVEARPTPAPVPETLGVDSTLLAAAYERAAELPRLRSLLVARDGELVAERYFHGASPEGRANVKSVSKSIVSALVGIAIAQGEFRGPDQPIAPFFSEYIGESADPRKREITLGNLLSMQSGLERTSGPNYGAWVQSRNWVRYALSRPVVAEPGGPMLYSTGNTHLLSAILTEATGQSTLEFARRNLAEPLGIRLRPWTTDPQGIYFGGNEMRLTPREMLRFGELYRNQGRYEGRQIVPAEWVRESLVPRTRSPWSGEAYGYGWFISEAAGHPMFYAWGYGGQFIFVIPDLELTVVTTSDPNAPRGSDHLDAVRELVRELIVPAAERGEVLHLPAA